MTTANEILAKAASQIGYSRWNDPDAGTIYGRWYAHKTGSAGFGLSGVPFCAMGVSWVFDQLNATDLIPGGIFAYCPYGVNNARKQGRTVDPHTAAPGDIVFFDWNDDGLADHVGLVEANHGSYLQTIEFNTSPGTSGSQGNGGGVYRRARGFDAVQAVVRPLYDGVPMPETPHAPAYQTIPDGYWGKNTVKDLQRFLGTEADGVVSSQEIEYAHLFEGCTTGWEWTPAPEGSQLIASIQAKLGVDADGILGPGTVNALGARYGITGDGVLDGPSLTITALQKALNTGKL